MIVHVYEEVRRKKCFCKAKLLFEILCFKNKRCNPNESICFCCITIYIHCTIQFGRIYIFFLKLAFYTNKQNNNDMKTKHIIHQQLFSKTPFNCFSQIRFAEKKNMHDIRLFLYFVRPFLCEAFLF